MSLIRHFSKVSLDSQKQGQSISSAICGVEKEPAWHPQGECGQLPWGIRKAPGATRLIRTATAAERCTCVH